jgi:hypothetical protein
MLLPLKLFINSLQEKSSFLVDPVDENIHIHQQNLIIAQIINDETQTKAFIFAIVRFAL